MLKSSVCDKSNFPYGDNENVTFYDPSCIEGMYLCKDLCGNKCQTNCKIPHNSKCTRGKLPSNFLNCPIRNNMDSNTSLEYLAYELVIDKNIKEGKKPYKKMEKIYKVMNVKDFIEEFNTTFPKYAKHKLESWFINTVKNSSKTSDGQCCNTMVSISDFAQISNYQVKKKHQRNISI